jgi:hypothetical protein
MIKDADLPTGASLEFLPLWARLRGHGHLWHGTSPESLDAILRDGQITPNIGQFPSTFPQSKVSYSRHMCAISLFDFDTENESLIFDQEFKWGSVLIASLPATKALIRINREALDRTNLLVPIEISQRDRRLDCLPDDVRKMQMYIPCVEALHIGPISTSAFAGLILLASENGKYRWEEVGAGLECFRALLAVNEEWVADYERRTAERHARGDYTFAEAVEASIRAAENNR